MFINWAIFLYYTNGKVTQMYINPHDEYYLRPIKPTMRVFFLSFADLLFMRPRHMVIMGTHAIWETPICIKVYKDVVTGIYSLRAGKLQKYGTYSTITHIVNEAYEVNPVLRFKVIRLIQLLEHYSPENFEGLGIHKGCILKSTVLNSSSSIPIPNAQAYFIPERDSYPGVGAEVPHRNISAVSETDEHQAPDSTD